jgi:hypothetical protein
MPQATVTFPYNTIQSYAGNSSQDYPLTINCPITSDPSPTVAVTLGSPPLILEPGAISGGSNTATVTAGPTYQNGQITLTVRATPDSSKASSTTNVIINLNVAVTYQYNSATDGPTPTAAITMFQPLSTQCGLHGSDGNNAFYGHSPSVAGTTVYPANSIFSVSVSIPVPLGKTQKVGSAGDAGDVVVDVSGNGSPTCATVYLTVTVNESSV